MTRTVALLTAIVVSMPARADGVQSLHDFVRQVGSGRADFTQTVTSPDGAKSKTSNGVFEFERPQRFRFEYTKPYPQLIVADGAKVWVHDPDLNQVSVRDQTQAVGATPAALLAGADLQTHFDLSSLPAREGLEWVRATPKSAEGGFKQMDVGFKGAVLAAVEILDGFGQRSVLRFDAFAGGVKLDPARFRFVPPPGADVVQQ